MTNPGNVTSTPPSTTCRGRLCGKPTGPVATTPPKILAGIPKRSVEVLKPRAPVEVVRKAAVDATGSLPRRASLKVFGRGLGRPVVADRPAPKLFSRPAPRFVAPAPVSRGPAFTPRAPRFGGMAPRFGGRPAFGMGGPRPAFGMGGPRPAFGMGRPRPAFGMGGGRPMMAMGGARRGGFGGGRGFGFGGIR